MGMGLVATNSIIALAAVESTAACDFWKLRDAFRDGIRGKASEVGNFQCRADHVAAFCCFWCCCGLFFGCYTYILGHILIKRSMPGRADGPRPMPELICSF